VYRLYNFQNIFHNPHFRDTRSKRLRQRFRQQIWEAKD